SMYVAKSMKVERNTDLVLDDYALGPTTVPVGNLYSLQNGADRVVWLQSLAPSRVEGPAGSVIEAVNAPDAGGNFWLSAAGTLLEQGLVIPSGGAATYSVLAGAKQFYARIAVPDHL